ncbi:MAG: RNA-directed DNA polymerase [Oscillospiraceae bacterium]|nr:RNA-directed DNA polymerase [Oscillospiraceae bacterium]
MSDYEKMHSFENLYKAHLVARRGKRNKAEVIRFEMNLSENLCKLQETLKNKTYKPQKYKHFMIYEPKERSIFAPDYADRVVQHCLCDNIIMPKLEPRLIYDNAACRIGKGTHFSIDRLSVFMRDFYKNHGTSGYFLKCDIMKYFYSIDHNALKQKLSKVFNEEVYSLLCSIIDSYEVTDGVGLPLGNQASQWFALYYLDAADRLIKEKLRIKYYVRYMDDFILLHHDKEYLRHCLDEIRRICGVELKIELNNKTQIFAVKNGVDYLGWHFYLTDTGKVIRKLKTPNKRRLKRRMKLLQEEYRTGIIDIDDVKRSLVSTHGHLIHGHTYRFREKLYGKTAFSRSQENNAIKGEKINHERPNNPSIT